MSKPGGAEVGLSIYLVLIKNIKTESGLFCIVIFVTLSRKTIISIIS